MEYMGRSHLPDRLSSVAVTPLMTTVPSKSDAAAGLLCGFSMAELIRPRVLHCLPRAVLESRQRVSTRLNSDNVTITHQPPQPRLHQGQGARVAAKPSTHRLGDDGWCSNPGGSRLGQSLGGNGNLYVIRICLYHPNAER